MKKCGYCGAENADDAARCAKCGEDAFVSSVPPPIPGGAKLTGRTVLFKLLAATVVWLAVTGISLHVACFNANDVDVLRSSEQWRTESSLRTLGMYVQKYERKFGLPPPSLHDLLRLTNEFTPGELPPDFLDGWGHPLILTNANGNCFVISYGRDGKPGGEGLDADMRSNDKEFADTKATFQEFLHDGRTQGMIGTCIVCGGLAFALTLFIVKVPDLNRRTMVNLGLKLFATVAVAAFVAAIIAALHIPSGH